MSQMVNLNLSTLKYAMIVAISVFATSCDNDEEIGEGLPPSTIKTQFFIGVEAATDPATEIITPADNLTDGEVSPVDNGIQQPAWMSYFTSGNRIISGGYTSAPEFTSYELENGVLTEKESFFTDLGVYAHTTINSNTLLLMGSVRSGYAEKKIYQVNTETMSISNTTLVDFGNDEANGLISFPVDMKVREDKLFVAYYMKSSEDFSTPDANQARVAVFSYPELAFEKIITDDRTSSIGRYYSYNALEIDEKGDIYTFSPSSMACGYAPVPANNSGILRIKSGKTVFDTSYFIDFEALSGGYKINDLFYIGNGKAVVKVLKEDETNESYLWGAYAPVSENPLIEVGIVDLYNKTFEILADVPKSGGGWNSASLKLEGKLYLGLSSSSYAAIYEINAETNSVKKGAIIDGNYAKAILSLTNNN